MSTWLELKRYLLEIASCVGQLPLAYTIYMTGHCCENICNGSPSVVMYKSVHGLCIALCIISMYKISKVDEWSLLLQHTLPEINT